MTTIDLTFKGKRITMWIIKRMNPVFGVIRHALNELFEEAFLHYLSLNTDIENFKNIWWSLCRRCYHWGTSSQGMAKYSSDGC